MKTFKLDETGDLVFDGQDFVVVDKEEEVNQSLVTRLQIRLDEFFLDEFIGLSWDNIFSKSFVEENCRADIIECLSQDVRVQSIDEIIFTRFDRKLTVSIHVTLTTGEEAALEEVRLIA